ncbi:pyridoxamine 5'-phosphate oxidase family protein [Massilia sp. W12]|uniref:pyridoxamine 5'-phosphate oxidase family protein n=1 Tax=Massilia sp. W12 TaxID=3126507 RepID=UPI0030D10C5E
MSDDGRFPQLSQELIEFIQRQHLFFVSTATAEGRINLSPKGMDSLRVLSPTEVLWVNGTGTGNETATHLQTHPRMTMMFCSFDKAPLILRLYGQARMYHCDAPEWPALLAHFEQGVAGARQVFVLEIDLVQTSCGFGVPRMEFVKERGTLEKWANKKGEAVIREFWRNANMVSLDGLPTGMERHLPPAGAADDSAQAAPASPCAS